MTTTTPELLKSLLNFHLEVPLIKKDGRNEFKNYSYARLEDILIEIRPILNKNGLFITHLLAYDDNKLITRLYHSSGGYLDSIATLPFQNMAKSKNAEQEWGSSLTYAKRYNLCNVLNLIVADDEFCTTHGKPEQKIPDNVTELPKAAPKAAPKKAAPKVEAKPEFDPDKHQKVFDWFMNYNSIPTAKEEGIPQIKDKFSISKKMETDLINALRVRLQSSTQIPF